MTVHALFPLLLAAGALAQGAKDPAFELSPEMSREVEKAEDNNLELAASAAEKDAEKTAAILAHHVRVSAAAVLYATTRLDEFIEQARAAGAPPVENFIENREDLGTEVELLGQKRDAFETAAAAVPFDLNLKGKSPPSPATRESDLRRARKDAAAAAKRLGVDEPWAAAKAVLAAAESYQRELKGASDHLRSFLAALQAETAAAAAAAAVKDPLVNDLRSIEIQLKGVDRELEMLRHHFTLQMADRQITGKAQKRSGEK